MTSRNINLAERLEYEDDIGKSDRNVEPNAIGSYSFDEEKGLEVITNSFEGLWDDHAFLSILEKSYSDESSSGALSTTDLSVSSSVVSSGLNIVSSSESDDLEKDEDRSEYEYDFRRDGGYSSDDMLSEESESSSCPSECDSLNLPLSNMFDGNDYYENDEANRLTGDVDLKSEIDEAVETQLRSKSKSQQKKLGNIYAEEDSSDLKERSTIFDEEVGDANKEHKEERFPESLPHIHSSMTSSIDEGSFKRADLESAQIPYTFILNHQQMSNFSDQKRMPFMIDNQDDEISIISDKTQKIRNTRPGHEGSSTSTFDCTASVDEQWITSSIAPILVESSSERQPLSVENKLAHESISHRYTSKSNQTRSKKSRFFYLYFTIGLVAIVTSVFVGILFGLRRDMNDNETSTKEPKTQEAAPPSAFSSAYSFPSSSPTISILQQGSVRQDEILKIIKSVSGASILNVNSPQYAALRLILDEDGVRQHTSDDALIQRYSIAVLFFSWTLENVICAESECTWNGILCKNNIVTNINLSDSKLLGSLPNELSQLTSLVTVDLSNNLLKSTFPSEIGSLTSLLVLRLNGNGLTSPIPTKFGQLKKLTVLDIGDNQFVGDFLTNKSLFLSSLTNLNLSGNGFSGTIPKDLYVQCPSMVQLGIDRYVNLFGSSSHYA